MSLRSETVTRPTDSGSESESRVDASTEILLVGTFGGGGIHQYVERLDEELAGRVDASLYDMHSNPKGDGLVWILRSLVLSLVAALKFPFRSPPDIVHVHASQTCSFYRATPYVFVVRHLWRRPVVFHVHGSSFDEFVTTDNRAIRWLQSAVFARCDRIVVLSEYWRQTVAPRVDPQKLTVIPNAVSVDEYDPRYDRDSPLLVFVSNMFERKGILEFVDAIDELATIGVEFDVRIAGDGPLADAPADLADRHDCVQYLGYVSEDYKRALLSQGTVYVLPTYAEGLPIALLEGMAGGNAVVSTSVGSIPEVVDEEGGVVIEPGDTESLALTLRTLVESPERVREMGRYNRRLVQKRYSWATVVDSVLDVYSDVLPGPGSDRQAGTRQGDAETSELAR